MAQRYVIQTFVSAASEKNPSQVITVPSGSVIDVPRTLKRVQGLIEVAFGGETLLMLAEDIRRRGRAVRPKAE